MAQKENQEVKSERKVVSRAEFEKRVDIERGYCEWTEYMNPAEARTEAYRRISKDYEVAKT